MHWMHIEKHGNGPIRLQFELSLAGNQRCFNELIRYCSVHLGEYFVHFMSNATKNESKHKNLKGIYA